MIMARKYNFHTMPMNYIDDYTIMALNDGNDSFVRIGNSAKHIDLHGFSTWEEADMMAKMISNSSVENLEYVSMR